jgi:hypothetical protein
VQNNGEILPSLTNASNFFVFRLTDYLFQLCFYQPCFHVKGTGVKGKTSPETEPDFYSMPFIKADDASPTLKRYLKGKVAVELEEKCKCSDPALCRKKQAVKMMNYKEYAVGDDMFSFQRNESLAIGIPSIDAPVTGSKKTHLSDRSSSFDFSSSTAVYTFSSHMSESNDFCHPLLLPYLEDTNNCVPRSWNKSLFGKSLSENSLSALQSLQDPILSPSSSSFSLDEMFQRRELLDINTDSIFSDHDFDGD